MDKPEDSVIKKNIIHNYFQGIIDHHGNGESYRTILRYFFPEFITALLLYALVPLIDARWIANLKSTSLYATVGVTNILIHFIIKAAEGFSVGTIIIVGHYNGLEDYKQVGKSVTTSFWVSCFVGGFISLVLYSCAYWIYALYGVPEKMILLGIPFLRLKAIAIFFMFLYFAFIGFLRGIKKPRIPMQIFIIGSLAFLFFDYVLISGRYGFPALGLQGSALASVIQYALMFVLSLLYILFNKENHKYGIALLSEISDWIRIKNLISLSWPIVLDKATFAAAYIWLGYLINPMGKYAIASYSVIKDLERLAIQPAAAFAQVITFLVSNSYGIHDWQGIKNNIKKTIILSSIFVFCILIIFSWSPQFFIQLFDPKNKFTDFASTIFPIISIFVFFDLLQLILSGALRGAGNVKIVMLGRLCVFLFYFMPISWLISVIPFESQIIKFLLIYGSFYLGNGLMSVVYINRFRGERWKTKSL